MRKIIYIVIFLAYISLASASSYILDDGYESGHYNTSQWYNQTDSSKEYSYLIQSNKVFYGDYSAKVMSSCNDALVANGFRSELVTTGINSQQEIWVGFAVMVDEYWEISDYYWNLLAQWHATEDSGEAGISPPLALEISSRQWQVVVRNTTIKNITGNNEGNRTTTKYNISSIEPDVWTKWVFHIKWSPDNSGELTVWKDGVLVVNRTNQPIGYNDSLYPYFKTGIYRLNTTDPQYCNKTAYNDQYKIMNSIGSYAEVYPNINTETLDWINGTVINYLNNSIDYPSINISITQNSSIIIKAINGVVINFTNMNAWSPYNDIKDSNTNEILASNVDSYSITLQPNQQIEVGNFVEDSIVNDTPPVDDTPPVVEPESSSSSSRTEYYNEIIEEIPVVNTTIEEIPTIIPINLSVSLEKVNSILGCSYDVKGSDITMRIQWYKDDELQNETANTIQATPGEWYCLVNVTDASTNEFKASQVITIKAEPILEQPRTIILEQPSRIELVANKVIPFIIIIIFIASLLMLIKGMKHEIALEITPNTTPIEVPKQPTLKDKILAHINSGRVSIESLQKLINGYTNNGMLNQNDSRELLSRLHR